MKLKTSKFPRWWPYGVLRLLIWVLTFNAVIFTIIYFYDRSFLTFLLPFCVFLLGCFLYWKVPENQEEGENK